MKDNIEAYPDNDILENMKCLKKQQNKQNQKVCASQRIVTILWKINKNKKQNIQKK